MHLWLMIDGSIIYMICNNHKVKDAYSFLKREYLS